MSKNKLKFLIFSLLILVTSPIIARAASSYDPTNIYIPKEEIRSDSTYLVGQSVVIDGQIQGDLVSASQTLTINGQIQGDVIAIAQTININGEVLGDIRVFGGDINLNGNTGKNINVLGSKVVFNDGANAGGDLVLAATSADLKGGVGSNVYASANILNISSKIGKNVYLRVPNNGQINPINIYSDAIIKGDLNYTANKEANIMNPSVISGQITKNQIKEKSGDQFSSWLWRRLYSLFAALVVGLIIINLFRNKIKDLDKDLPEKMKKTLWPGIVILLLTPIIALILALTFIGLPLALITLAFWLIALYLSKIVVAIVFGLYLSKRLIPNKKDNLILVLVIGVTASWILFSLPIIGWLISLLATLWGLGLMYFLKKEKY
ncbi:MAG: hypothetical protein WC441_04310 [Patescibacteria group bacterium]